MNPNLFTTLLFASLFFSGCQGAKEENNLQSDAKTETRSELDTKDRYLNDVAKFLDDMIKVVESVSDENTAAVALAQLKQLDPRAMTLGKHVEELKAAAKESGGREDVVSYLQENGKTKLAERFQKLEDRLGKSKSESEYPELWESAVGLINKAKSN